MENNNKKTTDILLEDFLDSEEAEFQFQEYYHALTWEQKQQPFIFGPKYTPAQWTELLNKNRPKIKEMLVSHWSRIKHIWTRFKEKSSNYQEADYVYWFDANFVLTDIELDYLWIKAKQLFHLKSNFNDVLPIINFLNDNVGINFDLVKTRWESQYIRDRSNKFKHHSVRSREHLERSHRELFPQGVMLYSVELIEHVLNYLRQVFKEVANGYGITDIVFE